MFQCFTATRVKVLPNKGLYIQLCFPSVCLAQALAFKKNKKKELLNSDNNTDTRHTSAGILLMVLKRENVL